MELDPAGSETKLLLIPPGLATMIFQYAPFIGV